MRELAPGSSDAEVLARAQADFHILLTEDKDFGELVYRWRRPVPALLLMRISPGMHALKWFRLQAAIDEFGDGIFGRYSVVEESRFRSRPLLRPVDP